MTVDVNLDMLEETSSASRPSARPCSTAGAGPILVMRHLLLLWYLLVRYNESTEKFTVL